MKKQFKNLLILLERFIVNFFILFIFLYKVTISPLIGRNCRFIPTCSEYAVRALRKKGIIKGSFLTMKRIMSCHPFTKPRVDDI